MIASILYLQSALNFFLYRCVQGTELVALLVIFHLSQFSTTRQALAVQLMEISSFVKLPLSTE
jgi:hypothetical protein